MKIMFHVFQVSPPELNGGKLDVGIFPSPRVYAVKGIFLIFFTNFFIFPHIFNTLFTYSTIFFHIFYLLLHIPSCLSHDISLDFPMSRHRGGGVGGGWMVLREFFQVPLPIQRGSSLDFSKSQSVYSREGVYSFKFSTYFFIFSTYSYLTHISQIFYSFLRICPIFPPICTYFLRFSQISLTLRGGDCDTRIPGLSSPSQAEIFSKSERLNFAYNFQQFSTSQISTFLNTTFSPPSQPSFY